MFRPWNPCSSWRICWDPCLATAAKDVLELRAVRSEGDRGEMAHHSLTETLHLGRLEHILSTQRFSRAAGVLGVGEVTSSDDRGGVEGEQWSRTSAQRTAEDASAGDARKRRDGFVRAVVCR